MALYMGLELQSLALYVDRGLPPRQRAKSTEAGLEVFCAGALCPQVVLLYGASLVYGYCRHNG